MTVQQLLDVLRNAGWRETKVESLGHTLVSDAHRKSVTIGGKPELLVPPAVLRALLRHAEIQEP